MTIGSRFSPRGSGSNSRTSPGCLEEMPDRARQEFQRLGLQFTLSPVYDVPAGERPYLRAVGEGRFEHLAGPDAAFLTAGRSGVQPAGSSEQRQRSGFPPG